MRGLAVYVKEEHPFAQDLPLEKPADYYLRFWLALLTQCLLSFSSINHLLRLYAWFLISYHLIDEVLSINPSANVLVIGDFNVRQKDWLTYSGGTYRPGEPRYDFSISNDLTQMVNFPHRIPDSDSQSPTILDLFLFLTLVFVLQWLSLHWEILIMLLSQFPLTVYQIHNGIPRFIA